MTSPFEAEARERSSFQGDVSDLLARVGRDVGGISFVSLDEPEFVPDDGAAARREIDAKAAIEAEERRVRDQVDAARFEGLNEARRGYEMELETKLVAERRRLDQMRLEFARDRQRFFAAAESQVVKLALAVARKILHRDAMTEGLPLRATVKAALARVQDGSPTVLRVPESDLEAWRAMFSTGTAGFVQVVADERMVSGECVLETNVGRVELSEDVSMDEVERGFGELMQEQGY